MSPCEFAPGKKKPSTVKLISLGSAMVSVPFHQIARSTCPIVTILIYRAFYSRSYSTPTYLSLIPIIFGVGMATYGDYYFTTMGLILTFFGVLLASVKVNQHTGSARSSS